MSGLDPKLVALAAAHRQKIETPPPVVDSQALVRSASEETDTLLAAAAELLLGAGYSTHVLYTVNRLGMPVRAGVGWDLFSFVLTAKGTAHTRVFGGSRFQDERAKHRKKLKIQEGEEFSQLAGRLVVAGSRERVNGIPVLAATTDGRAEIYYDTYDQRWMLLADWLNEKLASKLRE